jgi:hypothetical protein
VDPSTRLGKSYRSFAGSLTGEPGPVMASPRFDFLLKPFRLTRPAMLGAQHDFSSQGRYVR